MGQEINVFSTHIRLFSVLGSITHSADDLLCKLKVMMGMLQQTECPIATTVLHLSIMCYVICWQPRCAERNKKRDKIPPTWIDRLHSPGHDAMILFIYLFCTSSNFWGWHKVSRGLVKAVSVTKNGKRKRSHVSSSSSFYLYPNLEWHFPVSTTKGLVTPG